MHPIDELVPILKKLRLSGVLESLELRVNQAAEDSLSPAEFLLRLLGDEADRRDSKQLELRLRKACFEHRKSLEDFDFTFNPKVPKSKIIDLATCTFLRKNENVALVGQTGVGKSHIAQAVGHRACVAGHSVLYLPAQTFMAQLRAARGDGTYDRKLQRIIGIDLLILDDLGLRPLVDPEPIDLYEVIRQRYERGSMIVTSNRSIEEWTPLFGDDLLAGAAMDRFLHHAHVLEITGKSYRTPAPQTAKKGTSER